METVKAWDRARWRIAPTRVILWLPLLPVEGSSYGKEFKWEEESGGFGRGKDRIDSAAIVFAGWIAFAGADLGHGGTSGAGADAEGKVEGACGYRHLGGGEGCRHCFSLRAG